jgi:hypothetical protein
MNSALRGTAIAFTLVTAGTVACSRSTTPRSNVGTRPTEVRSDGERAEERRRAEDRAEERRAEERRAEARAEERRAEERRAEIDRDRRRPVGGGPSETAAQFAPAMSKIAAARCERQVECGNIGPHGRFPTRVECIDHTQSYPRDGLSAHDCPLVDRQGLNSCVQAIRHEDCGNSADTIARVNACRSANLCVK